MILNETADSPPSAKAAARFLLQAAFGPDQDDPEDDDQIPENVEEVRQMGFAAWIDDQFTRPVGRLQPFVEWAAANENALQIYGDKKNYAWWNRAMGVPLLPPDAPPEQTQLPDPLRQRVAFAFSQIIVISDRLEDLAVEPVGMAHFYDHLLAHSFGNFRDLLRGQTTPARIASPGNTGTATMADVDAAIDNLFHHPDTEPFIGRQLIQRFVTSNPSPAYVGRVAAAFADNGAGVRGDLSAVIKTLLLDPEARDPARLADPAFGKLREPFLRCVNLARAFNATAQDGFYSLDAFNLDHLQQPFNSPSVFNFFLPTYSPPGPLTQAGLTAPEFQLANDSSLHLGANYFWNAITTDLHRWGSGRASRAVRLNLEQEMRMNVPPAAFDGQGRVLDQPNVASLDPDPLLRRLDLAMTGGTLRPEQFQIIREALDCVKSPTWTWPKERLRLAIYLIATSPEFNVLR